MNAPTTAAAIAAPAQVLQLAPAAISPSPFNRKHFDAAKQQELTDNVAAFGVLQPILVRPAKTGAKHELVFGERRWRAAVAAKLATIPAMVRDLSDVQVVELQIIENQKREDVHPLEEAEGYEHLLRLSAKAGEKLTPEAIGARICKSRSYVYGVLKLLDLCPEARKAFYAGELDRSRALLIARIGHHDTQRKALKEILEDDDFDGEPMSYRRAQEHIADHYMLNLKAAPFDTQKIYFRPGGTQQIAGACAECPRRTGNMKDLFTDPKQNPNVCTDPHCYGEKKAAALTEQIAKASAGGVKCITGAEAKRIKPAEYGGLASGYLSLDEEKVIYKGDSFQGIKSLRKTVGAALAEKTRLLEDPHTGELVPIVQRADVAAALAAKGLSLNSTRRGGSGADSQKAAERRARIETQTRLRILARIRAANRKRDFGIEETRLVAATMYDSLMWDNEKLVVDAWNEDAGIAKPKGRDYVAAFAKRIASMSAEDLKVLLIDMALIGTCHVNSYGSAPPKKLYDFAARCGIDVKKVAREVRAETSEKKAARKGKGK